MNYTTLADTTSLDNTILALTAKGYKVFSMDSKESALEKVKELIPEGATLMNGSSVTLESIGFTDLLKSGNHKWNNLHAAIVAESDPVKQSKLRKEATMSDFYIGSVHALTEKGEMIIASNTGSQFANIVFSSNNLIFVIGNQKIVPNLEEAMLRIKEQVIPLEDVRMKAMYGIPTTLNKLLTINGENPMMGRTISIVLVNEVLGY